MALKYHERLEANLKALKDGQEPPYKSAESEAREKFAELDKTEVQQRIMDPNGTKIALSYGEEITVYPYTMREKRRAGGFLMQISADAFGGGARSEEELKLRIASLLMRREDLETELFRLAAYACFKPGSATDEKVLPIVVNFQQKCASDDIFTLFKVITDLSEFKAPKL